jgi:hypothetical protein
VALFGYRNEPTFDLWTSLRMVLDYWYVFFWTVSIARRDRSVRVLTGDAKGLSCFPFHRLTVVRSHLSFHHLFLLLNWTRPHAELLLQHKPRHHHKQYFMLIWIFHIGSCFTVWRLCLSVVLGVLFS